MGLFSDLFGSPKPQPTIIIKDALGKELDRIAARDLCNLDLRNRNWSHADLSKLDFLGANLEASNLFGAKLRQACFRRV